MPILTSNDDNAIKVLSNMLDAKPSTAKLIYKYRRCSDRTIEILSSKKLYAPRPDELNDPLDSQVDIEFEYQRAQEDISKLDDAQGRKAFLLFLLNSHTFNERTSGKRITLNQALQRWIRDLGILSFSKNQRDALMWTHYAAGHSGVNFGFDMERVGFSEQLFAGEVEYVAMPRYRALFLSLVEKLGEFVKPWENKSSYPGELGDEFYTKQISAITRENLLVKSERWKYEEEFRIVLTRSGLHSFDPIALREIIFGTKTSKADIARIEEVLRSPEWQHIKLKKVTYVPGSFDFEVAEYRP